MVDKKMTADEARTFSHTSIQNAMTALDELVRREVCDGSCTPYSDIFTFNRWKAQSMSVKKGSHGAKLCIFVNREQDDGTISKMPWYTTVFCRHQVEPTKPRTKEDQERAEKHLLMAIADEN